MLEFTAVNEQIPVLWVITAKKLGLFFHIIDVENRQDLLEDLFISNNSLLAMSALDLIMPLEELKAATIPLRHSSFYFVVANLFCKDVAPDVYEKLIQNIRAAIKNHDAYLKKEPGKANVIIYTENLELLQALVSFLSKEGGNNEAD